MIFVQTHKHTQNPNLEPYPNLTKSGTFSFSSPNRKCIPLLSRCFKHKLNCHIWNPKSQKLIQTHKHTQTYSNPHTQIANFTFSFTKRWKFSSLKEKREGKCEDVKVLRWLRENWFWFNFEIFFLVGNEKNWFFFFEEEKGRLWLKKGN